MERAVYLVIKNGLQRQRPQGIMPSFSALVVPSDSFSFPSGHTAAAFCLPTMTGIVFGGPFLTLYGWACGVGLSRGLLGAHFPGDTIAGAIIGSAIAMMVASQLGLAWLRPPKNILMLAARGCFQGGRGSACLIRSLSGIFNTALGSPLSQKPAGFATERPS